MSLRHLAEAPVSDIINSISDNKLTPKEISRMNNHLDVLKKVELKWTLDESKSLLDEVLIWWVLKNWITMKWKLAIDDFVKFFNRIHSEPLNINTLELSEETEYTIKEINWEYRVFDKDTVFPIEVTWIDWKYKELIHSNNNEWEFDSSIITEEKIKHLRDTKDKELKEQGLDYIPSGISRESLDEAKTETSEEKKEREYNFLNNTIKWLENTNKKVNISPNESKELNVILTWPSIEEFEKSINIVNWINDSNIRHKYLSEMFNSTVNTYNKEINPEQAIQKINLIINSSLISLSQEEKNNILSNINEKLISWDNKMTYDEVIKNNPKQTEELKTKQEISDILGTDKLSYKMLDWLWKKYWIELLQNSPKESLIMIKKIKEEDSNKFKQLINEYKNIK